MRYFSDWYVHEYDSYYIGDIGHRCGVVGVVGSVLEPLRAVRRTARFRRPRQHLCVRGTVVHRRRVDRPCLLLSTPRSEHG